MNIIVVTVMMGSIALAIMSTMLGLQETCHLKWPVHDT